MLQLPRATPSIIAGWINFRSAPRLTGSGSIPRFTGSGSIPRLTGSGSILRGNGSGPAPRLTGSGSNLRGSGSGSAPRLRESGSVLRGNGFGSVLKLLYSDPVLDWLGPDPSWERTYQDLKERTDPERLWNWKGSGSAPRLTGSGPRSAWSLLKTYFFHLFKTK